MATWALMAIAYAAKTAFLTPTTPLILDSDDAMRLVEVRDLLAGQGWFDLTQHRLNTPFGASMHWSRLVDAPEAALLALFRPFAGEGAQTWLMWVWPLLLLGPLLFFVLRIARTLCGDRATWPVLVLTPLSLITLGEFTPGRVDHHSVQILLTLAMVDFMLRGLNKSRDAALAGVAGAAAITVGVEGLPMVAAGGIAIALASVFQPALTPRLRDFALGLACASALGLALTVSPSEWALPRLDAISVVYVAMAAVGALIATVVSVLPLATLGTRLLALGALGAAAIAVLVFAFPALLRGPYAALDPWLVQHWLLTVSESQSFIASFIADPVYPLAVTVPVIVSVLALLIAPSSHAETRTARLISAGMLLAGLLVMLVQIRAARIVTPLALPGNALAIALLVRWAGPRGLLGAGVVAAGFLASSGLAVAIGATLLPISETSPSTANRQICLMPQAFAALASLPPARTMAPVDLGSHILLFTHDSVVGAPYHRNQNGLLDTFRFFNGPIDEARGVVLSRGIGRVVTCNAMPEMRGMEDRAADSLINLLAKDTPPVWLHERAGPGPLRIFDVAPANSAD